MAQRLTAPEIRTCADCCHPFVANWPQRLCNPCKYGRAARSTCTRCGAKTGQVGRSVCGHCRYGPVPELLAMSAADCGWLAGSLEGEGYMGVVRQRGIIRVAMTDGDVIRHAYEVSGVGTVNELPRLGERRTGQVSCILGQISAARARFELADDYASPD
jgi:hypothetical protein